MKAARKTPLARHRAALAGRGLVRVEVNVRRDDSPLIRGVAAALADPQRRPQLRALLRARFVEGSSTDLKALLAAAPLDGIDLERSRDTGRDVDL